MTGARLRVARAIHSAKQSLAGQSSLLTNAGALTAGNLGTAALGFVYWWLAARQFSAREVGLAAAAVSIMNLLAQIGELGLGPLLISELHLRAKSAGQLVSAALAVTFVSSAALALSCLYVGKLLALDLGQISNLHWCAALFVVGVATTGFTVVLDQAFVGLLRSEWQFARSVSFAVVKLALLAVLAFATDGRAGEAALFATWVLGAIASLAIVAAINAARRLTFWHAPNLLLLRPVFGSMMGHHAVNVALQTPTLALPYLVALLLSPQANAPFYAGWTLVNVILLGPASLSAVVVSVARRDPSLMARRLRLSLGLSALIVAPASLVCFGFSSFILGLFNPGYPAIAGSSLALLGFGTIGMTVKYHFIAIQRLANRTYVAAGALAIGAVAEVGAARLGGQAGGLQGLT